MIIHEYETTIIYHPEVQEPEKKRVHERLLGVIDSFEGSLLFHEEWGARKMAYAIRKEPRGLYHYFNFVSTASCIQELERVLRIESEVMRFLTVRLGENVDPGERQQFAQERAQKAAEAREAAEAARAAREANPSGGPRRGPFGRHNQRSQDRR